MDNWRRRRSADAPADDIPFALAAEGAHGSWLTALNAAAWEVQLRPGQRLTDARTICPELRVEPADPASDAATLRRLAAWAQRWSPWIAVDAEISLLSAASGGLLADITGGAHLFGGEKAMLRDMARALRAAGYAARIAVSPTVGASWALARHGRASPTVVEGGDLTEKLDPLGVQALRLDADAVLLLTRLGLKTIGALRAVPRLALARRFATEAIAANPLIRLDQALGRIDEPVTPIVPEQPIRVLRRVTDPVTHVPILQHLLGDMAAELCRALERGGKGLRRVRFEGFRVDGGVEAIGVETARPMRDPAHLRRLFDDKFEALDAGFCFDAVVLTAARHEPLDDVQSRLLGSDADEAGLSRLIDRLAAKLGPDHVRRPVRISSHIPERSVAWRSALWPLDEKPEEAARSRPIRLLDRPEPIAMPGVGDDGAPILFVWRKLMHRVAKCEGPERIAPEWWRERSHVRLRDYYRVEDEAGRRYWLYREGADGDGRGDAPGWFLHGLFA